MRRSTSTVGVKRRRRSMTWENPGTACMRCLGLGFMVRIQLWGNWISVYGTKLIETSNNPSPYSSIINVPGESTLRRDFLRLQLANKERSEALRRQQLEQQQNEGHKHQLLAERQKRIEEQKEQRRRLEEVRYSVCASQTEFTLTVWVYTSSSFMAQGSLSAALSSYERNFS